MRHLVIIVIKLQDRTVVAHQGNHLGVVLRLVLLGMLLCSDRGFWEVFEGALNRVRVETKASG